MILHKESYDEKWKQEMMSYPKESLINLLAMYGQERERLGYCLMHLGHSKHGFEINEEHLKNYKNQK